MMEEKDKYPFAQGYAFKMVIDVRDYEVDVEGIVNNAEYLHYMEHTRHQYCLEAGYSFKQMRADGLTPVVTKIEIEYRSSLGLGDQMLSCINVERRGPRFIFVQDIFTLDGRAVTSAIVSLACVRDGHLTRGDELASLLMSHA